MRSRDLTQPEPHWVRFHEPEPDWFRVRVGVSESDRRLDGQQRLDGHHDGHNPSLEFGATDDVHHEPDYHERSPEHVGLVLRGDHPVRKSLHVRESLRIHVGRRYPR